MATSGVGCKRHRDRLFAVGRFGYDLPTRLLTQEPAQAGPHHLVVIGDEDGRHSGSSPHTCEPLSARASRGFQWDDRAFRTEVEIG